MTNQANILDNKIDIQYERLTDSANQLQKTWANRVRIIWFTLKFDTTATIGNRNIIFDIRTAATGIYTLVAPDLQAASLTYRYYAQIGIYKAAALDVTKQSIAVPEELIMEKGWIFRAKDVNGVDANDTYTWDLRYINIGQP